MNDSNPSSPVLEIHDGDSGGQRLVIYVRCGDSEFAHPVRLTGPWRDPGDAHVELEEVHEARTTGELLLLDWASVSGADVLSAHVQEQSAVDRRFFR